MSVKYCTNCGHGNPPMSNGISVNFCSRCGNSVNDVATFNSRGRKSGRDSNPHASSRRRQQDLSNNSNSEIETEEALPDLDEAMASLRESVIVDIGMSGPMKAGNVVGMGATGFSRPKGRGDYDPNKFKQENRARQGDFDIIGDNG